MAEEIAAEALVKTWRMHYKLGTIGAIRAYLYKIVHRDSLHYLRKSKHFSTIHLDNVAEPVNFDTPFESIIRSEISRDLFRALNALSPANRQVIEMHFFEGKSTGQIAKELNVHPSTVKTQKIRGLKALRKNILRPVFILFTNFFSCSVNLFV